MPISQSKYVSITSGVGGQAQASRKDLILRIFTKNNLFPMGTVLEFTSAEDVQNFAGASSMEAKCASAYFGWVSKQVRQPEKISFMGYSLEATAPYIRSTQDLPALTELKSISDGAMTISMGGTSFALTGVNFSSANAYADIASTLQTAIHANEGGGTLFTAATVTYNAEQNSFVLTGGETGANTIVAATAGSEGTDISSLIGWNSATNPILSNGTNAMTLTDVLNNSVELSDNFATFAFLDASLLAADYQAIGTWNDNHNYQYMFVGDVTPLNYTDLAAEAAKYSGMCLNYNPYSGDTENLPAFLMPATILAATNYDKVNGTVNYMYQQFPTQAIAVTTNELAETLDPLKINYNGQTQKSGTKIEFYQDGYLADGTDIAPYANEIWLKDAITTELLNLQLSVDRIPASDVGVSQIVGTIQNVASEAVNNGTITPGKELTNTQKAYITQLTGDDEAWQQIFLTGYLLDANLVQSVDNNVTKYICEYTLIYSKGDSIRKVEGTHVLI